MSVATEVHALRSSAGLSRCDHVAVVEVSGPGALELLQSASTQSPYLREGRVRQTLFLKDDASVFADALVVSLGDRFLVLAEGPDERELVDWLSRLKARLPDHDPVVVGAGGAWSLLGLDGPYAWEVMSGLFGPAIVGMPYLSLLFRDEVLCVRAGKTGEYGYLLLVPPALAASVEARLLEIGAPLGLAAVGLEALDTCALESWHFTMRTLRETKLVSGLTPLELQLQWRVGYRRPFVGADALRARRSAGAEVRLTCFTAKDSIAPGAVVQIENCEIGEVLAACPSPTLGVFVGAALLQRPFAHPHLDLSATTTDGALALRTATAFLVDNESLHVQPHLGHNFANRGERL